jgi:hypothetical protein
VSTGLQVEQHRVSHLHDRRDQAKGSEPLSTISFDQPIHAPSSSAFKAIEDAKVMQINAEDPAKTVQIRADLNPK